MTDEYILILFTFAVSVLVLIVAKLASLRKRFAEDTGYICYKTGKQKYSITPLLIPSLLTICICLICMCGMTWAWYCASVQSSAQKITAACYDVTVETVKKAGVEIEPENGGFDLDANTTYTIILKAKGSVQKCGGYCLIECGDTKYYTQTFEPGQAITITLKPEASGRYTFTGVWGRIPSAVAEDDIIRSTTEDISSDTTDNTNRISIYYPAVAPSDYADISE